MDNRSGQKVIEDALSRAAAGSWLDAPAGYSHLEGVAYMQGMASAYLHALEMLCGPAEPVMSPGQLRECVSFMHFYMSKYECPPAKAASIYINMLEN